MIQFDYIYFFLFTWVEITDGTFIFWKDFGLMQGKPLRHWCKVFVGRRNTRIGEKIAPLSEDLRPGGWQYVFLGLLRIAGKKPPFQPAFWADIFLRILYNIHIDNIYIHTYFTHFEMLWDVFAGQHEASSTAEVCRVHGGLGDASSWWLDRWMRRHNAVL